MASTRTRTSSGARTRHVPQRTCIACRRVGEQSSFVRLVRTQDEDGTRVVVDEGRRRLPGRGAYLCRDQACWERGLKGPLSATLRTNLSADDREALRAYAARFAPTSPGHEAPQRTTQRTPERTAQQEESEES